MTNENITAGQAEAPGATPSGLPDTRKQNALTTRQASTVSQPQAQNKYPAYYGTHYMQNFLARHIQEFTSCSRLKTGYANIDTEQPLYPGFYVLGAIPSLGKTTFAAQMADQIAESGTPVLLFSLEQSAFELFSKSLSRRIYQHSLTNPSYRTYSSMEIRRGDANGTRELQEQTVSYVNAIGDKVCIVECNFAVTVEDILSNIDSYRNIYNINPVVIIDYLQIISPSVINGKGLDGRASIDHIVHALKSYQSKHKMTIFTICSVNRNNYLQPIDFESFKESGGIEYTADCVWGLQLQCIHQDIFSKESKIADKRVLIQKAKSANPREVELMVLKNRFGPSTYSFNFQFNPKFDTFTPVLYTNGGMASVGAAATGSSNTSQSLEEYWGGNSQVSPFA